MLAEPVTWTAAEGWQGRPPGPVDLVLYFGERDDLSSGDRYRELAARFPGAHVVGCSTGGQIQGGDVADAGIHGAALSFARGRVAVASSRLDVRARSRACGAELAEALAALDLAGVFVLADGLNVNGSDLVAGIAGVLGHGVPVTGGLAGDGPRFEETLVGGDGAPAPRTVAAIGFYGEAMRIGHGCSGGWSVFGPRRRITRSDRDVLYELEGAPALDLYRRYVGEEHADDLALAALPFPLKIHDPEHPELSVVRSVLATDPASGSVRFAGDVPEGWVGQLMRGSFDRLVDAAADAARHAAAPMPGGGGDLAILVSCIGRRALMGQRTADEIEAAQAELPEGAMVVGFYSYGEIAPDPVSGRCGLHNQTMTITTIGEV